jgi:hypothetical protein
MRLYLIDGFLRRLSASTCHGQFVLGGAYTLYKVALGPTRLRLTQDADYSVNGVANAGLECGGVRYARRLVAKAAVATYGGPPVRRIGNVRSKALHGGFRCDTKE